MQSVFYAYARLLRRRHPRKARIWFRAMVFVNPVDNLGAGYFLRKTPS
jgi:hypothetical protein